MSKVGEAMEIGGVMRYSPEPLVDGIRSLVRTAVSSVLPGAASAGGDIGAAQGEFSALLNKQMAWQFEMQKFSAESNIEKTRHEIAMAPIRNMRVG